MTEANLENLLGEGATEEEWAMTEARKRNKSAMSSQSQSEEEEEDDDANDTNPDDSQEFF